MFRRLFAVGVCAILGLTTATAADPNPDELIRQYAESVAKAAELLDAVKDAKSATDAKPKLDELATKQAELKAAIGPMTTDDRSKAVAAAEQKLSAAHERVLTKEKAAYKALHGSKLFDAVEKPREKLAET
jgi:hypothetical protein